MLLVSVERLNVCNTVTCTYTHYPTLNCNCGYMQYVCVYLTDECNVNLLSATYVLGGSSVLVAGTLSDFVIIPLFVTVNS